MSGPQRMAPPPADDEDDDIEVTRETLDAQRRAQRAKEIREAREAKTRRSWYTSVVAADAFQRAVDDLHHATRVPKHEVVAALLQAAIEQAPKVEKQLHAQVARVRPVRGVGDVSPRRRAE